MRSKILSSIRATCAEMPGHDPEAVRQRLENPRSNSIPARGDLDYQGRVDLFISEAQRVDATVTVVTSSDQVPGEISRYLAANNLPMVLKKAPDPFVKDLPWDQVPLLDGTEGRADDADQVSVSHAFAGVAETGTLVFLSGPDNPTTLNFLPPVHIALVSAADFTGNYEQVWARLRKEKADERGTGFMPRSVNFITGPSRTADIEQTLLLGIHGPQKLHIVIIDEKTD